MAETAADVISKLTQAGWPEELGKERWAAMKGRIEEAARDGEPPHIGIAELDYDTESIYSIGLSTQTHQLESYADLIALYGKHGWGVFSPTDIVDTFDEATNSHTIGFTLGGEPFTTTFETLGDWVSPELETLINSALEAVGAKERFLLVPYPDQIAYVAFVSEDAMKRAEALGLVPSMQEMVAEQMSER